MNITLSAEAELIRKGREYAKLNGTSLNQLVRDYLLKLTGDCAPEKAADEFVRLAKSLPGKSERHFRFSRDDLYDRNQG